MPTTEDVAVVRRLYDAVTAADLDAAEACFAEDAVWRLPGYGALAGPTLCLDGWW